MSVCGDARRSLRGNDNPAPRGSQRAKKANEVKNLKGVTPVSHEIGCVDHVSALGRRRCDQFSGRAEKAREGGGCVMIGSHSAW